MNLVNFKKFLQVIELLRSLYDIGAMKCRNQQSMESDILLMVKTDFTDSSGWF